MIRTHIRIAHIASIRTESPVDSRQCDWGIRFVFNLDNYVFVHYEYTYFSHEFSLINSVRYEIIV